MKKLLKNLTAFLLVITLTLQFSVFATAQGKEATDDGTDIVYEIPEFRGEFEKHFQMADGTVVASTYAEPVNYYDTTDHTWKEIDNTLTQENGRYKNKGHGGFNVSFRGDNASGDLVEMSDGEYTLSWSVSVQNEYGEKDSLKQQVNASVKERDNKEKDKFAADKAGSGMWYNSPFGGNKIIDVDYTVSQHKVKEDITIYSKRDANVVYYTYNCPSLTAVLTEDNSILFVNSENETVFTVHTPYMYDSEGNGSYEFDISIQQRGDTCTVVMVPDKEWLSSPDRAYPVVIDPTVTNSKTVSNYDDTYIYQGDTAGANYLSDKMYVGRYNGKQNYALLKINGLPSVPSNSTLIKAELMLSFTTGSSTGGPFSLWHLVDDMWIEPNSRAVIPSTSLWTEETVCYANKPSVGALLASNVEANFGDLNLTFDITTYYSRIVSGTYSNNGFQIGYTDTTINDYNVMYTSNCGNTARFPVIKVVYTQTAESESNNTMATADEIELMPYPGTVTSITGTHTSSGTTVDNDYFKFAAPRHGGVDVTLYVTGGNANTSYTVSAYNSSGSSLSFKNTTMHASAPGEYTGSATISFTTTKDENLDGALDYYYICVVGDAGSTLPYRITVKYTTYYASLDWKYPLEAMKEGSAYNNIKANSPVGYRVINGKTEYHKGLDISAFAGEELYAVTDGVIVKSNYHYRNDNSGMGNYFVLWTGDFTGENESTNETVNYTGTQFDPFNNNNPYAIVYMHMSSKSAVYGQIVEKGEIIGYSGNTGGPSIGAHLHIEIYSTDVMPYTEESNPHAHTTAPNFTCIINPYDFFYDQVAFSGRPY